MEQLTSRKHTMIGMVHIAALPGTPKNTLGPRDIISRAVAEAIELVELGFDALLVENMHDAPYLNRRVGPEIIAMMGAVSQEIRRAVDLPLGIQILAGANKEALAIAHAAGLQFIRAEGFVYAHVADEGVIESDAGELLRFRKNIGAQQVLIATDIKKKHSSHAITADVSLEETAHTAEFFGADLLVVTGSSTGKPTNPDDLSECARGSSINRLVGSGVTPENIKQLWENAHGFIVGSYIKENGQWNLPIDHERCKMLIETVHHLRKEFGED